MPILIITIFYAIEFTFNKEKFIRKVIYALIISSLIFTNYTFVYKSLPIDSWQVINDTANKIYNKDKKQLLIYNNFIYRDQIHRYYNGKIPTKPYFTYNMDFDEAIIKKNYAFIAHTEKEILKWLDDINIQQYDDVILIQHHYIGKDLSTFLEKKDFIQKNDAIILKINDEPILMTYENNKTNTTTTQKH